ncbi:CDP-diacylglycerol diphosphatase [Rhizobium sp. P38BS-XIX]|uniref:CDP-diacylglycerol diphosphatase n=1 Tax=Rhizobium sp. P38BS-XIX TaxID=2726740 RepID=UPI001457040D|nr:CDP-diacylglycerol diphosphatase [Rhizobium sp. P38BS-XIX]NLR98265.1 CDP-diacylglycerol diphosphatase [Rhizobium sp. P38BS-XIX]
MTPRRRVTALAVSFLPLLFAPAFADSDVLWKIVHDKCVVQTAPCLSVNKTEHYAILKDLRGIAQVLLIPTDKITGIESPALLDPATPNFFADAWSEKGDVDARVPHAVPRDGMSLAVNALQARSQNQLHIHVDCLSADSRDALKADADKIGADWAPLPNTIAGHQFSAMRVKGETLRDFNPFLALAKTLKDPAKEMGDHNLVVVGADFSDGPGFIVLTDVALPTKGGEDVQDHSCAITH